MFCMLIVPISVFWLSYYIIVLQDAIIAENWVKGTWNLSVLFLTAACEPIIFSKLKVFKKKTNKIIILKGRSTALDLENLSSCPASTLRSHMTWGKSLQLSELKCSNL